MNVYKTPIPVRFRDLDAMGHVNNAVYFTYFEEGRKNFFFDCNTDKNQSFNFILARITCDYLRPVSMTSNLILQIRVTEIGRKSFHLGYRLLDAKDESVVYAEGGSIQVCYDYARKKSIEVPEDMREKLAGYVSCPSS
ncbi:MAG: acyl-CoA thioesterase [Desulfatirhabdiaceae bacterium]